MTCKTHKPLGWSDRSVNRLSCLLRLIQPIFAVVNFLAQLYRPLTDIMIRRYRFAVFSRLRADRLYRPFHNQLYQLPNTVVSIPVPRPRLKLTVTGDLHSGSSATELDGMRSPNSVVRLKSASSFFFLTFSRNQYASLVLWRFFSHCVPDFIYFMLYK